LRTSRRWLYAAVPGTAALFSLLLALGAAWIPIKAALAQWLIEHSWETAVAGRPAAPPWPWADTRPAALLSVPRLDVRLVVLEGASGRNLAFGPVFLDGTLGGGDRIISGHRDTHFRFLSELRAGDRLLLGGRNEEQWFEVRNLEVVDSRTRELVIEPGVRRLSLVTCYPFDSPLAGGPLRYVVTALPLNPRSTSSG
jgi:sortase A